ncbi:hypothetical protein HOS55_gp115 [Pseudomonas phage PMBT3]|uniref:Uncharacterized protein n=1 Tax=Pseudomonas phage PMBT3 TaxID=2059856 RepID=A0A2I6PI89_9CAUD|nr:hypothetical protein HOS55_gp115 [Pseudomonas phage PMBT3]AUM59717.1 hypothetical protein [Pseudomonas phage PMBT3]
MAARRKPVDTEAAVHDANGKAEGKQPKNYPPMASPIPVTSMGTLKYADPVMYAGIMELMVQLKHDMLPECIQMEIIEAMSPSTKRALVAQMAGLDASVVVTFKAQLKLIDAVCQRVINPDGTARKDHGLDISVKDALNMSMKVVGMLVKDLPKVLTLAKVQRLEEALLEVVHTLPKDKQDEVLLLLEELEKKAAKEGK